MSVTLPGYGRMPQFGHTALDFADKGHTFILSIFRVFTFKRIFLMSEEAEKKENAAQAEGGSEVRAEAPEAAEAKQAETASEGEKPQADAGAKQSEPSKDDAAKNDAVKAEPQKDAAPEETPEEKLQKELKALKEENQKLKGDKDELSRKLRDSDDKVQAAIRQLAANANEMKRMAGQKEREVQNAKDFAIQNFAKELLTVADDLDKALESMQKDSNEAIKAHIAGIELTKKALVKALAAGGVAEVAAKKGDVFDPNLEQQVAMIPMPSAEPDSIVDIIQKGYTLNGRCIRAAKVVVVAPRPEEEEQSAPAADEKPEEKAEQDAGAKPEEKPEAKAEQKPEEQGEGAKDAGADAGEKDGGADKA